MPEHKISVHIFYHPTSGSDPIVISKLDDIFDLLTQQGKVQEQMDQEIVDLVADVKAGTTVQSSVLTLITGLAKKIEDLSKNTGLSAEAKAALVEAHTTLTTQAKAYADAVAANTAPPNPAP